MKVSTVDEVIKRIFSQKGIFQCIEEGCAEAPITIADVVAKRAKEFLPSAELIMLKGKIFNGLAKLEDIS